MARPSAPSPVQAIVGEDSYLAEEALERVLDAAIGKDRQDSVQVFQGDESKWAEVVSAARTGSLFVPHRAIVIRRADKFVEDRGKVDEDQEGADKKEEADHEGPGDTRRTARPSNEKPAKQHPLLAYCEAPNPDVTLILVMGRPDRRRIPWSKFFKGPLGVKVLDASPLKGQMLKARVREEIQRRNLKLTPDAVAALLSEVGQDLRRLIGELDKLEAWVGDRRTPLSSEDVDAVLGQGLAQPLYSLGDSFSSRDTAKSAWFIAELLGGLSPNDAQDLTLRRILPTLHRTLRQLRLTRVLAENRVPYDEVVKRLGLPENMEFKARLLLEASRRWTDSDIRNGIRLLGRADRRMKLGADPETAMVAAVVECCGGGVRTTSPRPGR